MPSNPFKDLHIKSEEAAALERRVPVVAAIADPVERLLAWRKLRRDTIDVSKRDAKKFRKLFLAAGTGAITGGAVAGTLIVPIPLLGTAMGAVAGVASAFVSGEPLANIADMLRATAASRSLADNKE